MCNHMIEQFRFVTKEQMFQFIFLDWWGIATQRKRPIQGCTFASRSRESSVQTFKPNVSNMKVVLVKFRFSK